MIAVATLWEDGSPSHLVAHALCAIPVLRIPIHRIQDTHHITEAIIVAGEVATIIIIAADFTSHLDDDGAN